MRKRRLCSRRCSGHRRFFAQFGSRVSPNKAGRIWTCGLGRSGHIRPHGGRRKRTACDAALCRQRRAPAGTLSSAITKATSAASTASPPNKRPWIGSWPIPGRSISSLLELAVDTRSRTRSTGTRGGAAPDALQHALQFRHQIRSCSLATPQVREGHGRQPGRPAMDYSRSIPPRHEHAPRPVRLLSQPSLHDIHVRDSTGGKRC